MKTFRVKGFALVTVEVEIEIEGECEGSAMEKAEAVFRFSKNRQRKGFIVSNSHDDDAVHNFKACEAREVQP